MKNLFDQTQFSGMKFKNRFIRSATYEGLADEEGYVTEEFLKVYEDLTKGGGGTIITSSAFITDVEQSLYRQIGIYNDSYIDTCKKLTEVIHRYNTNIIMQMCAIGVRPFSNGSKAMWLPSGMEKTPIKGAGFAGFSAGCYTKMNK